MKHLRWIINSAGALLVLLLAGMGARYMVLTKPKVPQHPPARTIPTVEAPPIVALKDYEVRIAGFGSVRPKVLVDVTPQVAGEVIEKHPRYFSGEYITQDQELFTIDPTDYELTRDRMRSEIDLLDAKLRGLDVTEANVRQLLAIEEDRLALAQADLGRVQELIARGAVTETELDRVQETLLARQLQIRILANQLEEIPPLRIELEAQRSVSVVQQRQAETDLARTVYRSPFNGRVICCPLEVGERVQAGQQCGTIYATGVMEIPVSLSARDLDWIDRDLLTASDEDVSVDAETGEPNGDYEVILAEVIWPPSSSQPMRWYGCVSRIEAGLEAETRTARVVVKVINPSIESGRPVLDINMFCEVGILGQTVDEAFLIPRSAVQPIPGETASDLRTVSVYLIEPSESDDDQPADDPESDAEPVGRLARRQLTIARYTDGEAMILPGGGLEAGDRVITEYLAKPVLGMAIRARRETTDTPPTDTAAEED